MQGPWADDVPNGWQIRPLWSEFRRGKKLGDGTEELLSVYRDYGVVPKSSRDDNFNTASEDLSKYQRVSVGDLVVNKMKAWQGSLGISNHDGIVSPAYFVYRSTGGLDRRFAHYLLRSKEYADHMAAISSGIRPNQWDLDPAQFAVTPLLVPPPSEQGAISDYLDQETAQIDAFIAKNQELMVLLSERRTAASQSKVEHHVGMGSRLKYRFREIDVRAGDRWEALPLLSVSINHGVRPREDDTESARERIDLSHYKVASTGDIVLNRMRAFQGGLGVAAQEGLVSPDYAVLRPTLAVDAEWMSSVMRTPKFVSEMVMRLRGIGSTDAGAVRTPRISVADLGEIRVSVPSAALQSAELQAVMTSTERIEKALTVAQRSVELARERRAALISAAVTGKIDVGVMT